MYKFPVYQPSLIGKEKEYVVDCLNSTWISSKGDYINKFETSFAAFLKAKHAVSVCNGTVAILLMEAEAVFSLSFVCIFLQRVAAHESLNYY